MNISTCLQIGEQLQQEILGIAFLYHDKLKSAKTNINMLKQKVLSLQVMSVQIKM